MKKTKAKKRWKVTIQK